MNSTDYNSIIAELRQEYLESFDGKFSLFRELFNKQDFSAIELEYHKLKGTGKTYGVPEISTLCAIMESICHHHSKISENQFESALELLSAIRNKYLNNQEFILENDSRFLEIKKDFPA